MDGKSLHITEDLIAKLKAIVPAAFTEDKIDVEQLKLLLGESVHTAPERYQLSWAGKSDAYRLLQLPSSSTLRPLVDKSMDWEEAVHTFIEGENLEALKVIQKAYYGQIRAIYIDPPYNTGNDSFIYNDDFKESKEAYFKKLGERDEEGFRTKDVFFRPNRRENGQFHSNWLSMMLPRLFLARNLLHEEGIIFVSIDDNELASLKLLMDEVFGEENYRNTILVRRYDKNINTQFMAEGLKSFNTGAEYILIYSKSTSLRMNPVFREASEKRKSEGYWKGFWNDAERKTMQYELLGVHIGRGQWKWKAEVAREAVDNYREYEEKFASRTTLEEYWRSTGSSKKFLRRKPGGKGMNQGVEHWIPPNDKILRNTLWHDVFASKTPLGLDIPFNNPKNPELIKLLLQIAFGDSKSGIVLDFFGGSGTTAHAVLEYNAEQGADLRFITIQLPETIDEKTDAYAKGHRFISDITSKRIRDVIAATAQKEEGSIGEKRNSKMGFRYFKLANSNLKVWRGDVLSSEEELIRQIKLLQDPIPDGVSDGDLLWELAIKNGIKLSERIEKIETGNGVLYFAPSKKTAFVLDRYTEEIRDKVAALDIRSLICLDALFKGKDSLKTNAMHELERRNISFQSI